MSERKTRITLANIPLCDRFDIGGVVYEYDVIDWKTGRLNFSRDGDAMSEIKLKDTPDDFQRQVILRACEQVTIPIIEADLGRKIDPAQHASYLKAWQYLHTGDNAFFKYCVGGICDYHALDRELMQTMLLGMTRSQFSSVSALAHFDTTGKGGAGKNDLVNRVVALVPPQYLDLYSSVSPTALQYETLEKHYDAKDRPFTRTNKERFKGKIICITEVNDAAGYTALKALAETDESAEFTHMATVNGKSVKMTITGPRCVIITSVEGVNDSQIKRRFIHTSISEDCVENKLEKLEIAEEIVFEEKDIRDDPRTAIAQAGIDLIFSTQGVVFERIDPAAKSLLKYLNVLFINAGYGITNIKQFYTLCQCSALWKRFNRSYTRIEVSDVCEAWFLLATFERETITKTTKHGIATLQTIKELCDHYDEEYERDQDCHEASRPTRAEIAKASDVPQATVYRLLRTREDVKGSLGELLELGYVTNSYQDSQTVFELTELGRIVLEPVTQEVTVNGTPYRPVEPNEVGDPGTLKPASLEYIIEKLYASDSKTEDA